MNLLAAALICMSQSQRLDTAALHYKSGCLISAINICSKLNEYSKYNCYETALVQCDKSTIEYRQFLDPIKPK